MKNKTCGECKYFVTSNYLDVCVVECETRRADSVCNHCDEFEPKVITNGDVIRQMSNEELAEFLTNPPCFVCSKGDAAGECTDTWRKKDCKSAILKRLNAPAEINTESEGEDVDR